MNHCWIRTLVLAAAILAFSTESSAQTRIVSRDSTISLDVPRSFQPFYISADAELQFADSTSQTFVVVFPEGRRDLVGWNLTRHSMITIARLLTGVADPMVAGPTPTSINGHAAVQYSVQGAAEGMRITYLHTTIDAPDQFVQVIAWTTESRWAQNRPMIEKLVSSVQVMPPSTAVAIDPFEIVPGVWAWEHDNEEPCGGLKQTFVLSDNRKSMQIHHNPPIEQDDGPKISVTQYVVEGASARMLNTYIPSDTRTTDDGKPVKWDLVVIARNRLAWHRADWPEGSTTGMLRRCQ